MAPTATIQTANAAMKRSRTRPLVPIMPRTLGGDGQGVNGAIFLSRLADRMALDRSCVPSQVDYQTPGVDRWATSQDAPCWEPREG